MPVVKNEEEFQDWISKINNATERLNGTDSCYSSPGKPVFRVGQRYDRGKNLWKDPYTGEILTEDNLISRLDNKKFECAAIWGTEFRPARCDGKTMCGLCEIDQNNNKYIMKGFCKSNLIDKSDYDLYYYIYGLKNGKIYFKGLRNSHIFFDSDQERWILKSLR